MKKRLTVFFTILTIALMFSLTSIVCADEDADPTTTQETAGNTDADKQCEQQENEIMQEHDDFYNGDTTESNG